MSRPRPEDLRVLLVEDDRLTAESVTDLLTGAGYGVVAVEDGQAALDLIAKTPSSIDVIVADVVMPRLDGLAFFEQLRNAHPRLSQRLIWLTAHSMTALLRDFLVQTRQPIVPKPFDGPTLLDAVARLSP